MKRQHVSFFTSNCKSNKLFCQPNLHKFKKAFTNVPVILEKKAVTDLPEFNTVVSCGEYSVTVLKRFYISRKQVNAKL